jgi:hypothetical protein
VWAHDGEDGKLLRSARQMDAFIDELWSLMQAMPEYRGRTTFIITTDHGRGAGLRRWRDVDHGTPRQDRDRLPHLGQGHADRVRQLPGARERRVVRRRAAGLEV